MSPTHREPPRSTDRERSGWSTTWIFVTLVILTVAMAVGFRMLTSGSAPVGIETRAAR